MIIVKVEGCNVGFEKIAFTALQRECAGKSLSEAYRITDNLSRGGSFRFEFVNDQLAEIFLRRAIELKAIAMIVLDSSSES